MNATKSVAACAGAMRAEAKLCERCATTARDTIDGAKLRQAARDVLGVGVDVEPPGEPT